MAKLILPQTKTFSFSPKITDEEKDKIINDWKKEVTLRNDHVSPNPPAFGLNDDGYATYVYTFATQIDDGKDPKIKK